MATRRLSTSVIALIVAILIIAIIMLAELNILKHWTIPVICFVLFFIINKLFFGEWKDER